MKNSRGEPSGHRGDHVIVSPDGGGFHGITDTALSELGLTRRVVLSIPHFLYLSSVLTSTDLVAIVPSRLGGFGVIVRNSALISAGG